MFLFVMINTTAVFAVEASKVIFSWRFSQLRNYFPDNQSLRSCLSAKFVGEMREVLTPAVLTSNSFGWKWIEQARKVFLQHGLEIWSEEVVDFFCRELWKKFWVRSFLRRPTCAMDVVDCIMKVHDVFWASLSVLRLLFWDEVTLRSFFGKE